MKKIQAIRGMNDLLPEESPVWQYVEATITEILSSYGYQEIRFPLLEQTDLFRRSIGEVTDIVEKEMYTFTDKNGDSITLRPEGTASCVRACEQHQLLYNRGNLIQKLWYMGPMFRHEKPQKGRLREFHQIGVEVFGLPGPDIDAELLLLTARFWQSLGIASAAELQLNNIGSAHSRAAYRTALVDYLEQYHNQLDEDSQRRLGKNPLRILDSKNEKTQAILKDAPALNDYVDAESKAHFEQLQGLLDAVGVKYTINPRLVRGLDYYSRTVFEWVTDKLGSQGAICAGGRYDGLVSHLGGQATPGVGFAMGLERLVLLINTLQQIPQEILSPVDVYLVAVGDVVAAALRLAESIHNDLPHIRIQTHLGGGSFKNQMKKADRSGAQYALILGEDEVAADSVSIKNLRSDDPQLTVKQKLINQYLN